MITTTGQKMPAYSKLEQLDDAQRETLHFWFEENYSYDEVARRLRQDFGLTVSRSTVAAYWKWHILPERHEDDAEVATTLAALPAGNFDTAILQQARALAWAALAQPHPDAGRAAKLLDIVRKAERHALAVKRLELDERRVALRERLAEAKFGVPAASAEKRGGTRRKPAPATLASSAVDDAMPAPYEPNSPHRPGYSDPVLPHAETSTKDAQPNQDDGSTSAAGCDDGIEVAAETQSCEGRSKGPEAVTRPCQGFGKAGPLALTPAPALAAVTSPQPRPTATG